MFVDDEGSTVFYRDDFRVFATGGTIVKADLPVNFTFFLCRMSIIQPTEPVCTTSYAGTRVVGIFVPAAPTKRYHPSRSCLSHYSEPTAVK